jgi:hypothetical protein
MVVNFINFSVDGECMVVLGAHQLLNQRGAWF